MQSNPIDSTLKMNKKYERQDEHLYGVTQVDKSIQAKAEKSYVFFLFILMKTSNLLNCTNENVNDFLLTCCILSNRKKAATIEQNCKSLIVILKWWVFLICCYNCKQMR